MAAASFGGATMSCFLCGKHRARSLMTTKKVLGKSQAVCAPSCKELEEMLAANAASAANAANTANTANAASTTYSTGS